MGMAEKLEELISQIQYMGGLESRLAEHLIANDVVPVVRCENCKYWYKSKEFSPFGWCLQRVNDLAYVSYKDRMEPDDFCSKGERKCE